MSKPARNCLYFHGSSEARVSSLKTPSFEHPFYVTSDLHYAMAFCTKDCSQTGDWEEEKTFTPASQNYVYVVTLKPGCNLFDFRDHSSAEFKKLYKVVDQELVEWIVKRNSKSFDMSDIFEFVAALQGSVVKLVDMSQANYLEYTKLFRAEPELMTPKLFLKACAFCKRSRLYGTWGDFSIHQTMAPILEGLQKQGFHAILTRETDFNDEERHSSKVTTNYAIGIFDPAGLDLMSLTPLKYKWLKKINPTYLQNSTSESSAEKIRKFIERYKKIVKTQSSNLKSIEKKTVDESKIDLSVPWYFGNNRSRNLRIVRPAWNKPFFLTTSYEYAENYSDYGVYKINLKNESELNILDFANQSEVARLNWPRILVQKIQNGQNDLNSLAYDLFILANSRQKPAHGLTYLEDTQEWRAAAELFKKKSVGILQQAARDSLWGQVEDHSFVLQMWKDINDAGFDGFMHSEFNQKILGIFNFNSIDKISISPVKRPSQLAESRKEYLAKNKAEPEVEKILDQFWSIKSRLKSPENDIDWWIKKPFSELKNFVLGFDSSMNRAGRKQLDYRREAYDNGARLLDTKDGYEIWYVPTYDAARILGRFYKGRSAKWCISSDDPEYWFDTYENEEFVLLIRENPKGDELDKIAIEMPDSGRVYNEDDFVPWDLENNDWTFTNDDLIKHAWLLFKENGQTREKYY